MGRIVSGLDNVPPGYERVLLKSRVAVKGEARARVGHRLTRLLRRAR
jgi:hypothetical protein